jgi:hypothetical protein
MLATLVAATQASAQAPPPPPPGGPAYVVPAYAPPAWLAEGVAVVRQANPAADCARRYPTGPAWVHDAITCSFESGLVSGATAHGACGMYLTIGSDPAAPLEPRTYCWIYFGGPDDSPTHTCLRKSWEGPDAWRGGSVADPLEPFTLHAQLAACLDAQRPDGREDAPPPAFRTSPKPVQKSGPDVSVTVTCSASCTATATGKLAFEGAAAARSFKLKTAKRAIAAGVRATLRLRVPRPLRRAAKRALKQDRKVRAKLTITVVDAAGSRGAKHRTVRLRL